MLEHTGHLVPQRSRRLLAMAVAILLTLAATALLSGCGPESTADAKGTATQPAASTRLEVPLMDSTAPGVFQTASFALGWFWGSEAQFGSLKGVIRTRVGYTGGTTLNPTYHNLGDHTETVQLDYDPEVMSYEELVKVFFASHSPTCAASSRQYMSAIFFHDADQERVARQVKAQEETRAGAALQTEILPASPFYLAEDYHQKYALQGDGLLMREFARMYPDIMDLVDSSAATRVNAYLYGLGSLEQLRAELDELGLSVEGKTYLLERLGG